MSKRSVIILTVAALIVGVVAGGWSVAAFFNSAAKRIIQHTNEVSIHSQIVGANEAVETLKYLKAGNITNAVKSLEMNLEMHLIYLEPCVVNPSDLKNDRWNIEVLQKVKYYRAEFPYKTNPDVERNVGEIFTALNIQTNR